MMWNPRGGGINNNSPYLNAKDLEFVDVRSGQSDLPLMTKKEIKDEMAATEYTQDAAAEADQGDDYMKTLATYTQPYVVGELKDTVLQRGLNRVNLIRKLSGLNNVVLDSEFNKQAQHGAWLMTKENSLDHYLTTNGKADTSYMTPEFKELCRMGTELANIYRRPNPTRCVDSFMGENGVPSLGHRWNVIGRHITSVGFGAANAPAGEKGKRQFGFGSMRFNMAAKPVEGITLLENRGTNWEITTWPTPGYFPINTTWFDVNGGKFWHFALNDRYQMDEQTVIVISQHEAKDGPAIKTWTRGLAEVKRNNNGEVTARTVVEPVADPAEKANVRVTDPRTCIFTLGVNYAKNQIYKVEIRGVQVRNKDNKFDDTSERKHLRYTVEFFSLADVQ